MSNRNVLIGTLALLGIIFLSNFAVDKVGSSSPELPEQKIATQKTTRPLQKTRTIENPISSEAVPVPKEVSSIKQRSFLDNLLNKKVAFTPIPDPDILPKDLRNAILNVLSVFNVTETLSSDQIRFGGPAVIKRLREGAVALLAPKTLSVYFNEEEDPSGVLQSGIGGNLFSQDAFTGPYTETSCGVGFYEVVEVDETEYCDVIRYDFYDDDLDRSIAIALSVTEEQYCNASCTQPSCKAVCEALLPQTTPGDTLLRMQFRWGNFSTPSTSPIDTIMDGTLSVTGGSAVLDYSTEFEPDTDTITSFANPVAWTSTLKGGFMGFDGIVVTLRGNSSNLVSFDSVSFDQSWTIAQLATFTAPQLYSITTFRDLEVVLLETLSSSEINPALNTAYLYDDATGTCGCGQPVYTSSCIDTNSDGFGDACVQVPGGDGQSTCATDGDCTQTFRGCLDGACVELRGSAGIAGIAQCDTDLECLPDEEKFTHSTCLGNQCVQVPGAGFDECGADAPWALPCDKQCILETVTITNPDGTTREEEICERPAVKYSCLTPDNLQYVADPELQDLLWSEVDPWGYPVGPQCALVRCIDENGDEDITPDECGGETGGSCLDGNGTPNDGACGLPYLGPDSLSSTESLVDFPDPIDGSEFEDRPELPPLVPPGGGGGGGGFATCADLAGNFIDDGSGGMIDAPDGIWDSCVVGGESNITCNTPLDCDRLERSQCAGEACVLVPGPGINQCGNPALSTWDPIAEAENSCVRGTCSSLATTLLSHPGVTLGEGGNCRRYCGSGADICTNLQPIDNLSEASQSATCTTTSVDRPLRESCAYPENTKQIPFDERLLQGLVDYADKCTASGDAFNIIWLTGGNHMAGSFHYQGRAADFTRWCGTYLGEAQWWADRGYGVCIYNARQHLHVSTGPAGIRTCG